MSKFGLENSLSHFSFIILLTNVVVVHLSVVLDVADWILLGCCDVHLVSEEFADVVDTVVDHSWTLQTETPGDHRHVLREAHRLKHLRTEDA